MTAFTEASVTPLSKAATASAKALLGLRLNANGEEVLAALRNAVGISSAAVDQIRMKMRSQKMEFRSAPAQGQTVARFASREAALSFVQAAQDDVEKAKRAYEDGAAAWGAAHVDPKVRGADLATQAAMFAMDGVGAPLFTAYRSASRAHQFRAAEVTRAFGRACDHCNGTGTIR